MLFDPAEYKYQPTYMYALSSVCGNIGYGVWLYIHIPYGFALYKEPLANRLWPDSP